MTASQTPIENVRKSLRSEMPVTQKWAYFDHAAVAPLPSPALTEIQQWGEQAAHEGDTVWPEWAKRVEKVRRLAAQLIGADSAEIALVPNTTAGINLVAEGLDWQTGDNVVTLADEFPSNLYPWMHLESLGVELRRIPTQNGKVDPNQMKAACDDRTRVVSASWIGYSTGYRQDISQIADLVHDCGALFFLDAIQGLGAFPLNVQEIPIDFLAADGHKWMLGPEGAGFAFIRKAHLNTLKPIGVGWNSVVHAGDFSRIELNLKDSAARYEGGSLNMVGFLTLGASLKFLIERDINQVASAILDITDLACSRLQAAGANVVSHRSPEVDGHDPRSGIVAFETGNSDPLQVRQQCLKQGVALACRGGRLRISPHAYNNEEDVEKLIAVLRGM